MEKTGWGIPLPQGLLEPNQCSVCQIKLNLDFMVRTFKHNLKALCSRLCVLCCILCVDCFCVTTSDALGETLSMQCIQNEIIINEIFCCIIMLGNHLHWNYSLQDYNYNFWCGYIDFFKILNNKLYVFKDLLSIVR